MADVIKTENSPSWWTLAWFGWCYVAAVAVIAVLAYASPTSDTNAGAFLALPVLTIPIGLVALLPAYVIPSVLGNIFGLDSDSGSWLVGTAFTCVWIATAWANAQLVQVAFRSVRTRRAPPVATSKETAFH
jgi:hypothetical protein